MKCRNSWHFRVQLDSTTFSIDVFAPDSFKIALPEGAYSLTILPADSSVITKLRSSGYADSTIIRKLSVMVSAGDTLDVGKLRWERFAGMRQAFSSRLPEWVWMEMDGMVEYIPRLNEGIDKFLIPSLPIRGRLFLDELHAPRPMLDGMSFQQFMTADNFFSYYCVTQREQFIDRLVASLYLREHETFIILRLKLPMNMRARATRCRNLSMQAAEKRLYSLLAQLHPSI